MDKVSFTIKPLEGFGKIQFGMSVQEAKALTTTYGAITADEPVRDEEYWADMRQYLRDLNSTEEEIESTIERHKEVVKDRYSFSFGKEITLVFYKDQLYNIALSGYEAPAYLGAQDLFALSGEPFIHYVATELQENPYVTEDGLFFLKHRLSFSGYIQELKGEKIVWRGPSQRDGKCGIFIGAPDTEGSFDTENTFIYQVIK